MKQLPPIPDPAYAKGVSAPFCGMVGGALVVAGGANFPDAPLLDGGAKRVYDDIWRFDGAWQRIGHLEDSTAYGATFQLQDALLLAGGTGLDKVYLLDTDGLHKLPPLPCAVAEAGVACLDGELWLAGAGSLFRCRTGEWEWSVVAPLPEPLVQPLAFASGDWLHVWGGFNPQTLELPAKGWKINLKGEPCWSEGACYPDNCTFVGSAGIPLPDGRFAVVGGVNRDIFSNALHNKPEDRIPYLSQEPAAYKFNRRLYVFDPGAETWSVLMEDDALALAGPGLACDGSSLYVAGGEIKPGVRSPKILKISL